MSFSSRYQGWLMKDQGAAKMPIPILPEIYRLTYGHRTETVNILELGEIIVRGDPNGIRVSFDSYFPVKGDPWIERYVTAGMRDLGPSMWRFMFKSFVDSKKPLQLVFVGTPVNFFCWCERFEISEEGGTPEINYSVTFAEHRETGVDKVEVDPDTGVADLPPQEPRRQDTRIAPATYELKKGDSLASIAKQMYGTDDASTVQAIFEANRDQLSNPMLIQSGMQLKMPL